NLLKNGPATLILSGANTYTGSTTVSAGSLQINGSLSSSAVTVQSGGRLTGVGVLGGTVNVQFGGTMAPGDGAPGALTINSTLTLAGSAVMEVSKSGSILTNDQIVGLTTVVYGGSLVVTNVGISSLAAGDTFTLFGAANYSGSFTNVTLPSLQGGLI